MINTLILVGKISRLTVNEPKDPEKAKRGGSAIALIQYGPVRDSSGGPVDFVNAAMVRIPNFKWQHYRDKLREGQIVEVTGHLQGIVKPLGMEQYFTVEVVADRIQVVARDDSENPFDFSARRPRRERSRDSSAKAGEAAGNDEAEAEATDTTDAVE